MLQQRSDRNRSRLMRSQFKVTPSMTRVRGEIIEARAKRRKGEMKLAKLGEIAAGWQRERQRNARLDKAHLPTCSATIFMSKVVMFPFTQIKCY